VSFSSASEAWGACWSGFKDFRMLEYASAGSSVCGRDSAVASLRPRRCPVDPNPLDALLDCVLDRLGGYWFEWFDEPLEAVEAWRSGEGEVAGCPSLVRGVVER
jgi:hypothetical protein